MITTKYVWTKLGEQLAIDKNLETRAENTPASFAYRPLERSNVTAKAWLDAGFVKKVDKPMPFLYFNGNTDEELNNIYMIKFLNENNIPWEWYDFLTGEIRAAIIDEDKMVPVSMHNIKGNLYIITEKDAPLDLLFEAAKDREIKEDESYA